MKIYYKDQKNKIKRIKKMIKQKKLMKMKMKKKGKLKCQKVNKNMWKMNMLVIRTKTIHSQMKNWKTQKKLMKR